MAKGELSKREQALYAINKLSKEYKNHPDLTSVEIWREEDDYGVIMFVNKYNQDFPEEYLGLEVIQRITGV